MQLIKNIVDVMLTMLSNHLTKQYIRVRSYLDGCSYEPWHPQ